MSLSKWTTRYEKHPTITYRICLEVWPCTRREQNPQLLLTQHTAHPPPRSKSQAMSSVPRRSQSCPDEFKCLDSLLMSSCCKWGPSPSEKRGGSVFYGVSFGSLKSFLHLSLHVLWKHTKSCWFMLAAAPSWGQATWRVHPSKSQMAMEGQSLSKTLKELRGVFVFLCDVWSSSPVYHGGS